MRRYLVGLAVLTGIELILALLPLFSGGRLQLLAASVPATAAVLAVLCTLWARLRSRPARVAASLGGAWVTMLLTATLMMVFTSDPWAAARIAEKGWLVYVLVDKVARGLFFGVVFGTVAFVWVWVPFGFAVYAVVKRVRPVPGAPSG